VPPVGVNVISSCQRDLILNRFAATGTLCCGSAGQNGKTCRAITPGIRTIIKRVAGLQIMMQGCKLSMISTTRSLHCQLSLNNIFIHLMHHTDLTVNEKNAEDDEYPAFAPSRGLPLPTRLASRPPLHSIGAMNSNLTTPVGVKN
jgi:hypothetical protein